MRLVQTTTLQVRIFDGSAPIPRYAALSHCWEDGEVVLSDLYDLNLASQKAGYTKLRHACRLAQAASIDWLWVDTVCIDRTSSAELSEAINAAFSWYRGCDICFAYLSDFPGSPVPGNPSSIEENLVSCRWMQRSWTLPELIASPRLEFYDHDWSQIGTKASIIAILSRITGIDTTVLQNPDSLPDSSLARRMSWARHRSARHPEDVAYSLLGVFGVSMPIIYGEGGQRAFLRLQEEIMKDTNDISLFAWESADPLQQYRGLLAISPLEFSHCGSGPYDQPWISLGEIRLSAAGIHISGPFWYRDDDPNILMALSMESGAANYSLGIVLTKWKNRYLRRKPASILRISGDKYLYGALHGHREDVCVKRHVDSRTSGNIVADAGQSMQRPLTLRQAAARATSDPAVDSASISTELDDVAQGMNLHIRASCDKLEDSYESDSSEGDAVMDDSEHGDDDMDLFLPSGDEPLKLDPSHKFAELIPTLTAISFHSFCQWVYSIGIPAKRTKAGALSSQSRKRLRTTCAGSIVEVDQQTDSEDDETVVIKSTRITNQNTWACPFYIRNSQVHQDCLLKTDLLQTITDVKAHLGAAHRRPIYCPICFELFDSGTVCDQHIRARICIKSDGPGYDGITHMQMVQLAERAGPELSPEKQWFDIWDMVFPSNPKLNKPCSPYFAAQGQIESVVCAARNYWAREGMNIVTGALKSNGFWGSEDTDENGNVAALHAAVLVDVIKRLVGLLKEDEDVEEGSGAGIGVMQKVMSIIRAHLNMDK